MTGRLLGHLEFSSNFLWLPNAFRHTSNAEGMHSDICREDILAVLQRSSSAEEKGIPQRQFKTYILGFVYGTATASNISTKTQKGQHPFHIQTVK